MIQIKQRNPAWWWLLVCSHDWKNCLRHCCRRRRRRIFCGQGHHAASYCPLLVRTKDLHSYYVPATWWSTTTIIRLYFSLGSNIV